MHSSHAGPPAELDTDLEVAPREWEARDNYRLLTGLVVPRPIAWVSTFGPDGVPNVAPHSYFNMVAHEPPHVVFSSAGEKDTLRNVRHRGVFVVNIVTMEVVEGMNFTAADLPAEENEFAWAGLTRTPAAVVDAPRVGEAKAHLECRLVDEVPAGNGHILVGEVVHVHVAASVWHDGRVDPVLLDPVCRLAGTGYARLGEVFRLPRPRWDDVLDADPSTVIPRLDPS